MVEGERDVAQELAQFNAAVDWSLASAVGWYDERLRQQQENLKAADRNKNEFLAVLGHELRNPLSPLRTGLELLERARKKPQARLAANDGEAVLPLVAPR